MTALRRRLDGMVPPRSRPRSVWAASLTGLVVSILVAVGVLLPVLGLIGTAAGATAGVLRVPVGPIALAIGIGYLLAIGLLALCFAARNGALAWVLGVSAVVSTLLVSVWPLVAVALAAVGQVEDVVPFIQDLIGRVLQR